jgi:hypothetical protein
MASWTLKQDGSFVFLGVGNGPACGPQPGDIVLDTLNGKSGFYTKAGTVKLVDELKHNHAPGHFPNHAKIHGNQINV